MVDIYKNINYNPNKKLKILVVFDDMICLVIKNLIR